MHLSFVMNSSIALSFPIARFCSSFTAVVSRSKRIMNKSVFSSTPKLKVGLKLKV